jgi:hypothetical protein
MSTAERTVIIVEAFISIGVVFSLVWLDSFAMRAGVGVGVLAILTPLTIRWGVRTATKSGCDSGATKATAEMLREHFRLQEEYEHV